MALMVQAIRGMNDLLPEDTSVWQQVEKVLRETVSSYGYSEVRMPIVEKTKLFCRAIGEVTDVVEKEMYSFEDRSGDHLSLRPEGTAGCVRACIEHNLVYNQEQRLWYMGPMFRHERPQKGRYRQFHQMGVEVFGLDGPDIDAELIAFTDDSETDYIQNKRVGLIEPKYFGKTVAKICTTPYWEEPGYTDFRSITPGEFGDRTPEEELALQDAGIIFIRDEIANSEIHPRINLAVSTAFATNPDNRPNDALLHARRNVDNLVRRVYDTLYSQLKRNETETNLSFLQSDIDVVVEEEICKGYMMDGTELEVLESETNPYDLKVEGVAVPVNSTLLIGFSLYVESPNAVSGGN